MFLNMTRKTPVMLYEQLFELLEVSLRHPHSVANMQTYFLRIQQKATQTDS